MEAALITKWAKADPSRFGGELYPNHRGTEATAGEH